MYGTISLNTFAKLVRISFVIVVGVLISRVNPWFADAQQSPSPPPYQQLRYEEDYSYLRDPTRRTEFWDIIKYVPFNEKGDWYLSVGGEARERYEYFHNSLWDQGPQDKNGYLLQRCMLHTDVHFGPNFRFFGQLKSGLEDGRKGGPRPPDEDKLDEKTWTISQCGERISFEDPNRAFFILEVHDMEKARAFLNPADVAEASKGAGVLDFEWHFVTSVELRNA